MGSHYEAPIRKPLVAGEKSYHDVSVDIARPIEGRANKQCGLFFLYPLLCFYGGWDVLFILYQQE